MVFSSTIFLFAFLPFTVLIYYLLNRKLKNAFLLLTSLFFYAWGEPRFILVLLLSILVNYSLALWIHKKASQQSIKSQNRNGKFPLFLSILFNLLIFFIFKYLNFTINNLNLLMHHIGIQHVSIRQTSIALPIGISFFTFQAMSYVFDVYRKKGEVQKNPLNVGLYITFFPQLIAGPIVRYQTVADEIQNRQETLSDFSSGLSRFIIGLSKKVILANTIAVLADSAFNTSGTLTVLMSWLGAIAYTLQIYFDFSGYSDMAIGLGRIFGFHFDENFDYPYASVTITEFWRRWHISLGSWFRDYVYIPLGGSRVNKCRLMRNLFIVWLLTGIWHGANWTFIIWGLLYFILLAMEKLWNIPQKLKCTPLGSAFYRVFTLFCIVLGWVLFRANNLYDAGKYFCSMFGIGSAPISDSTSIYMLHQYWIVLLVSAFLSFPSLKKLIKRYDDKHPANGMIDVVKKLCLLVLAVFAVAFTVSNSFNPFIYFNF